MVIDTLEGLETLIDDVVCEDRGLENIEEMPFSKGHVLALTYWRQFLSRLDALRDDHGMTVILVGHAQLESYEQHATARWRRYVPAVHWRTCLLLQSWCDEVLFATHQEHGRDNRRSSPTGNDGADILNSDRVVWTTPTAFCVAKNHLNLPSQLPLDFRSLAKYLAVCEQEQTSHSKGHHDA